MKQPKAPATEQHIINLFSVLAANLIGDEDRTRELETPVFRRDIPEDIPLQRDAIGAIYDCAERGVPPTRENVIFALATLYNYNIEFATKGVDTLLQSRTEDLEIMMPAAWAQAFMRRNKARNGVQRALALIQSRVGLIDDLLEQALTEINTSIDLGVGEFEDRDGEDLAKYVQEYVQGVVARTRSGKVSEPSLKFKGFVGEFDAKGNPVRPGLIERLNWGETTLITALPGAGKTALGGVLAEHNAWYRGLDVLYLHLETDQIIMGLRSVARNLAIPINALMSGRVDPADMTNPVSAKLSEFTKWIANPVKGGNPSGKIYYVSCGGWNVDRINGTISRYRHLADARKRGLLVIVDYYNIIDYSQFAKGVSTSEAMGKVAYRLRECIKRENLKSKKAGGEGVHCIVFAQEKDNGDGNDPSAYGSKQIIQYSQIHISIQRTTAEEDAARMKGGKQEVDALGNPRWLHRKGQKHSAAKLVILKANNHELGEVPVTFENSMFIIEG